MSLMGRVLLGKDAHCKIDALVGNAEDCVCLFETSRIPNGTEAAALDISATANGSETVADDITIG